MKRWMFFLGILVLADVCGLQAEIIRLSDRDSVVERAPILIAHRGGVVEEGSPECSATAIRLAAEGGYAMVELDVQKSGDGVAVVFHDRTLDEACGVEGRTADFSVAELSKVTYLGSTDPILSLDEALALCREVELGVMLDLKAGRDDSDFLKGIDSLIVKHGLEGSTVSFSASETARKELSGVMMTPTEFQIAQLKAGESVDLTGTFWFGLPAQLSDELAQGLLKSGAYIFPAINTFRYRAENHVELAQRDVRRLRAVGVHGFQIDSVYRELFDTRQEK